MCRFYRLCIAILIATLATTAVASPLLATVAGTALPALEPNGLMLPAGNEAAGLIEIHGVAQHPTFRKWQLDLQLDGAVDQTIFIAVSEIMQPDLAVLTTLDTTRYPNGDHRLRLRVVHSNLNYDEYYTPITFNNSTGNNSGVGSANNAALDVTTADGENMPALLIPTGPLGENVATGERWIEVDISQQMLTAWQGDTVVLRTIVSTGRAEFPTVTGTWPIQTKLTSTRMIGPGYDTPNVPWTMYFFRGYAVHGAYWHDDFGTPVSHGCINVRPAEAKLLFDWATVGTRVTVHK